jgi:hypothetical protein
MRARGWATLRISERGRTKKKMFKILDQRDNRIGTLNRDNVQRMLSSFGLYPFIERLK